MPRTFRPGKRLRRLEILAYIMLTLEVAFFYLVYLYVLADSYPQFAGAFLLTVFFVIEALIIMGAKWFFRQYREKVSCTVDQSGVTIRNMLGSYTMPWEDFESADNKVFGGRNPCPISFTVKGKTFMPNQYLADIAVLDTIIVDKIRDHAAIQEDLDEALEAYRILKV